MSKADAAPAILRLLETSGIGRARVHKILKWAEQNHEAISDIVEDASALKQLLSDRQWKKFQNTGDRVEQRLEELGKRNVSLLSITDSRYPHRLKSRLGTKAPPLLSVQGNPQLLNQHGVGFCGSRDASERGLKAAQDCTQQLANLGINIVSGYAAGVDMCTHKTALKAGGTTVIVLPFGVLHFDIKTSIESVWDWNRTAVVSEFIPGIPWRTHNAMQRNATICGLSDAMVLIEAGETGGSISAGKTSLDIGLPLFVAVYENMPDHAKGNAKLLKAGAEPLFRSKRTNRANIDPLLKAVKAGQFPSRLQEDLFS